MRSNERPASGGVQTASGPALVVDEDAAALMLGLSPRTLQRWRLTGHGPAFVRLGKRRMYRREDIEAFVRAGVVERRAA